MTTPTTPVTGEMLADLRRYEPGTRPPVGSNGDAELVEFTGMQQKPEGEWVKLVDVSAAIGLIAATDDPVFAAVNSMCDLEESVLACRTLEDLRSTQVTIRRIREAAIASFDRALKAAEARIASLPPSPPRRMMMPGKLTAAQVAFLVKAAHGPVRDLNRTSDKLEDLKLIRWSPDRRTGGSWWLTAAGRAALALTEQKP